MNILKLKPDALVVPEFDFSEIYPHMGLNEGGNTIMSSPVGPQWPYKGFFGMGYYLYGSNLNTSFLGGWDTSSPSKIAAKATIQTTWANRILPWFVVTPGATNTCSNAGVRILNGQCYVLDATTKLWSRQGYTINNVFACTKYNTGGTSVSNGSSDLIMPDKINVPAFPFCPSPSDWSSPTSDTTRYRLVHGSSAPRIVVPVPQNVAGIMCVFESQLVSVDGNPLNGTPNFLVQAGIDAGYNNDIIGTGLLEGAPYSPAIVGSRWSLANNDGTRRKHYVGTFLHADSYQDLTSAYNVAGGVSKSTAAQFQANMPHRSYQLTL